MDKLCWSDSHIFVNVFYNYGARQTTRSIIDKICPVLYCKVTMHAIENENAHPSVVKKQMKGQTDMFPFILVKPLRFFFNHKLSTTEVDFV